MKKFDISNNKLHNDLLELNDNDSDDLLTRNLECDSPFSSTPLTKDTITMNSVIDDTTTKNRLAKNLLVESIQSEDILVNDTKTRNTLTKTNLDKVTLSKNNLNKKQKHLLENRAVRIGKLGEYRLSQIIQINLLNTSYRLLQNVYLPIGDGKLTEIDFILISEYGLIMFESKNYNGKLNGKFNDYNWIYITEHGRFKIYNPIMQIKNHRRAVKELIHKIPVYSYLVFSDQVVLNDIDLDYFNVTHFEKIYNQTKLYNDFIRDLFLKQPVLNSIKIERLYKYLKQFTNVTDTQKVEHIKRIQKFKNEN